MVCDLFLRRQLTDVVSVVTVYYYAREGGSVGPFDHDGLRKLVLARVISPETLVCAGGDAQWLPLSHLDMVGQAPLLSSSAPMAAVSHGSVDDTGSSDWFYWADGQVLKTFIPTRKPAAVLRRFRLELLLLFLWGIDAAQAQPIGYLIYRERGFDSPAQAKLVEVDSVQTFPSMTVATTASGTRLEAKGGQSPAFVPLATEAGDPGFVIQEIEKLISLYPQYSRQLTVVLEAWRKRAATSPALYPSSTFTFITKSGKRYEVTEITSSDSDSVSILHAGGVARIEVSDFPDEMADNLPEDFKKALTTARERHQQELAQAAAEKRDVADKVMAVPPQTTAVPVVEKPVANSACAKPVQDKQKTPDDPLVDPPQIPFEAVPPVVKGLSIGMPIEAVPTALKGQLPSNAFLRPDIYRDTDAQGHLQQRTGFAIRLNSPKGYTMGGVYAGEDGKSVELFWMTHVLTDLLFKSADLSAEEFTQRFIDAYKIPKMDPVTYRGISAWKYTTPVGINVYVTAKKDVELNREPTRSFGD